MQFFEQLRNGPHKDYSYEVWWKSTQWQKYFPAEKAKTNLISPQSSYREVWVKFKDFSRTSQDYFSFQIGTVSGSGTGPLDYGATGPVPDS